MELMKRAAALLFGKQPAPADVADTAPVRYCRGCKHYTAHRAMCGSPHTRRISLVTGKQEADVDCRRLRADPGRCGPAAAWFEPKG